MKKIFTVFAITILAFSCNSKQNSEQAKNNVNKMKEVTSEVSKKVNEVKDQVVEKTNEMVKEAGEKIEETMDELGQYGDFIMEAKKELKQYSITDVFVEPYSKGIDISLITDKKGLSKDKFMQIAKNLVTKLRQKSELELPKVGVALNYQPNPNENIEQLYNTTVK